jgi:hypothetical protein
LDGLFRAKEKESPRVKTAVAKDENSNTVGLVESYIHQHISILELVGTDEIDTDWFKNSGIKQDDGGELKSLGMLRIYKDGDEGNDLFNSSLLSRIDNPTDRTTKWIYGTEGEKTFGDGAWKIVFKLVDNDDNITEEIVKTFIIDTIAPTLNITSQLPEIWDKSTFNLEGQTEPNLKFTTIVNGESQTIEE